MESVTKTSSIMTTIDNLRKNIIKREKKSTNENNVGATTEQSAKIRNHISNALIFCLKFMFEAKRVNWAYYADNKSELVIKRKILVDLLSGLQFELNNLIQLNVKKTDLQYFSESIRQYKTSLLMHIENCRNCSVSSELVGLCPKETQLNNETQIVPKSSNLRLDSETALNKLCDFNDAQYYSDQHNNETDETGNKQNVVSQISNSLKTEFPPERAENDADKNKSTTKNSHNPFLTQYFHYPPNIYGDYFIKDSIPQSTINAFLFYRILSFLEEI